MMKIKTLRMTNFRGFEAASIDFDPHMTCIIGVNGSGKTTVLSAVDKLMMAFLVQNHLFTFIDNAYCIKSTDARKTLEISRLGKKYTVSTALDFEIDNDIGHIYQELGTTGALSEQLPARYEGEKFTLAKDCPVFAFYYVDRNSDTEKSYLSNSHYNGTVFDAWVDVNVQTFDFFLDWFKDELLLEYQEKDDTPTYENPKLSAVRRAITSFFGDGFSLKLRNNTLAVIKDSVEFSFDSLSDGEKSLILLFADIARRLAIVNEHLDDPLQGSGIILIDEIEMHLHPAWQRKVCDALKRTFCDCQFIITTHSPQVLGELQPCEVRVLEGFNVYPIDKCYGLTSDDILDEVMDTSEGDTLSRDGEITSMLKSLSRKVDEEDIEGAKAQIARIEDKAGGEIHETLKYKTMISIMQEEKSHGAD